MDDKLEATLTAMALKDSLSDKNKNLITPISKRVKIIENYDLDGTIYDLAIIIDPDFGFCIDSRDGEIFIERTKFLTRGHFPPVNDNIHGVYLFDITDLSVIMRSPELLDIVEHKLFNNIDGKLTLKDKYLDVDGNYKESVTLTIFPYEKGLEINKHIIDAVMKRNVSRTRISNDIGFELPVKYGLLGKDKMENYFDRINNLIYTGRCDHIIVDNNHKKTMMDKLALNMIRCYYKQKSQKKFKTARIYMGYGKWGTFIAS
ncbi:Hypothetical protein HVR_LOCUS972 [uncultured virus]|nr:Hypothetical protein HVR_LOCUS972 [uncultured virus]